MDCFYLSLDLQLGHPCMYRLTRLKLHPLSVHNDDFEEVTNRATVCEPVFAEMSHLELKVQQNGLPPCVAPPDP